MANLQASGAIAIGDIKNLFGGPASPSMSNYYRGGSYIPASKTTTVSGTTREPSSGEYYVVPTGYNWYWYQTGGKNVYWNGSIVASNQPQTGSITVGNVTYYSGTLRSNQVGSYNTVNQIYAVYRTYPYSSTTTVNINTGIPSSGQISLSQFYSAEKP
jgi:hypothetical protein